MGQIKPNYVNNRFDTQIKMLYNSDQFQTIPGQNYGIGGGCHNIQYKSQPDYKEWRGNNIA